jgi:hypothetical protein
MKNCKHKKIQRDGLESKVLKLSSNFIVSDNHGRYIPYCDFGYHRGLIKDEGVCLARHCTNYYKLYIEKKC